MTIGVYGIAAFSSYAEPQVDSTCKGIRLNQACVLEGEASSRSSQLTQAPGGVVSRVFCARPSGIGIMILVSLAAMGKGSAGSDCGADKNFAKPGIS